MTGDRLRGWQSMGESRATRIAVVAIEAGLHARPAELFVRRAQQFASTINVIKERQCVDAKSILNVLSLAAEKGTVLTLEAVGEDAEDAVDALAELVNNGFAVDETRNQEQSS